MVKKREAGVIVVAQLSMMSVAREGKGKGMTALRNESGAMMISPMKAKATVRAALEALEAIGWIGTAQEIEKEQARRLSWARGSRVVICHGRMRSEGMRLFESKQRADEAVNEKMRGVIETLRRSWGAEDHVSIPGLANVEALDEQASRLWALWESRRLEEMAAEAEGPKRRGLKAL